MPIYFPYLEDSHGGLIMFCEWWLKACVLCCERCLNAHIVDYLSIVAHSNLVMLPYVYTLLLPCYSSIIVYIVSSKLFHCAISTHCDNVIIPYYFHHPALTDYCTTLPPYIVHPSFMSMVGVSHHDHTHILMSSSLFIGNVQSWVGYCSFEPQQTCNYKAMYGSSCLCARFPNHNDFKKNSLCMKGVQWTLHCNWALVSVRKNTGLNQTQEKKESSIAFMLVNTHWQARTDELLPFLAAA